MKLTELLSLAAGVMADRHVCPHDPIIQCVACFLTDLYDHTRSDGEQIHIAIAALRSLQFHFLIEQHKATAAGKMPAAAAITLDIDHLDAIIAVFETHRTTTPLATPKPIRRLH